MRPEDVYAFLQRAKEAFVHAPDRAAVYSTFENFYDRKLWHQLTEKLLEYVARPEVAANGDEMYQLYNSFIADFEDKINQLSLVQIALAIGKSFPDAIQAVNFLQQISQKVKSSIEAYALTVIEIAQYKLSLNDLPACKTGLLEAEDLLEKIPGVEPIIHASFYRTYANYDKVTANFNNYYKNALLFLACVPLSSLSPQEQLQRAHDLGLAALLADSIYNFGELLAHDILHSLDTAEFSWLKSLLKAFNAGDIDTFQSLYPMVSSQSDLAAHMTFLRQKMSLMALIEMLFQRQADERSVSFDLIAQQVRLPRNEIELLVMKAMSLKLIHGTIDEVAGIVQVKRVQPRVLHREQIASLATRLGSWDQTVAKTIEKIHTETPELFVQ